MKRSLILDALKLLVIFGALWAIFTFLPIFKVDKTPDIISLDTEEKMGKLLVKEVLMQEKEIKDPKLDTALALVTNRLVSNIGLTDYNYHFRVLDNPQINAFTLPGGNIFIYSGLIKFTKSPEELAAVLAHEIGHAEKRHVVNRLVKEFSLTVLFSVLTGNKGTIVNEIARTATSTVFDRKQEAEADDYGFHLLEKSKIDPIAFASFTRRINAEQGTNNLDFTILRTHPDNNSRIKAAMEYKTAPGFVAKSFNMDWDKVKASLGSDNDKDSDKTPETDPDDTTSTK